LNRSKLKQNGEFTFSRDTETTQEPKCNEWPTSNPADKQRFAYNKLSEYVFLEEIGKGSYAVVKLARHSASGEKYAIKSYDKCKLVEPLKKLSLEREIEILKKIRHPFIIGYVETIDTRRFVRRVTKSVPPGDGIPGTQLALPAREGSAQAAAVDSGYFEVKRQKRVKFSSGWFGRWNTCTRWTYRTETSSWRTSSTCRAAASS
jgi:hypothetical protein